MEAPLFLKHDCVCFGDDICDYSFVSVLFRGISLIMFYQAVFNCYLLLHVCFVDFDEDLCSLVCDLVQRTHWIVVCSLVFVSLVVLFCCMLVSRLCLCFF